MFLADGFFDWLTSLGDSTIRLGVIFLGIAISVVGVAFVHAWRKVRESALRTKLTAEMVQRGMPSEEIVRVLLAAQLTADGEESDELESDDPEVRLIKHLSDNQYEASDVQKVLEAARSSGPVDDQLVAMVKTLAENWAEADSMVSVIRGRRTTAAPIPAANVHGAAAV